MSKNNEPNWNEQGPVYIIARLERDINTESFTSKELFDYADALRQIGRKTKAITIYDSIDESSIPIVKQWLLPLYKGQTFLEMGKYDFAEKSFRHSVNKNPKSTVPYIYLSSALFIQEKFEDCISVLRNAIDLDGDRDEVYLNLAFAHRALGQLEDTALWLRAALSITNDYALASEGLTDVLQALDLENDSQ